MFDLSKRKLNATIGCTPRTVGPGTYDYDDVPENLPWQAPFLTSEKLFTEKKVKVWTEQIYNVKIPTKIKGGSTPSDYAPRFKYTRDDVLGPCAYEPEISGDDGEEYVPDYGEDWDYDQRPKTPSDCVPRRHRLYLCHVPLSHGPTTPSIPSKHNKYGYRYENGILKQIPDDKPRVEDSSAPHSMLAICNHYKGSLWTKSRTERGERIQNDTPGPSDYSPKMLEDICRRNLDYYLVTQKKTKCTPMRRFTDQIFLHAKKNKSPAPCDHSRLLYLRKHQVLVPFGMSTGRSKPPVNDNPPPGAYDVANKICKTRYTPGDKVAFGKKIAPPVISTKTDLSPASYYPKTTIKDEMNRNYEKSKLINAPFHRSDRKYPCNREIFNIPGPNWYCVPDAYQCDYVKNLPSSNFASKTDRSACLSQNIDQPEPASYSVNRSYRYATDKLSHKRAGIPKCEGFLCGTPNRFQPFYGLASPFLKTDCPGPTKYERHLTWGQKGWVFSYARRFPSSCKDVPSPDTYTPLNPDMNKAEKTFNIRLAKSIAKVQHQPEEMSFYTRIGVPKKLRCFPKTYTKSPFDFIF